MLIRFWGTRGSLPKPGPTTLRHGGNTSCVELRAVDGTLIVLDCGTGAHGLGQLPQSGTLPMVGVLNAPPGRYAVKFDIAEKDREVFMAAGAAGAAAIYTERLAAIHIIRKVILRVGAYTNYLILKLH